jgi:hypothetical protein
MDVKGGARWKQRYPRPRYDDMDNPHMFPTAFVFPAPNDGRFSTISTFGPEAGMGFGKFTMIGEMPLLTPWGTGIWRIREGAAPPIKPVIVACTIEAAVAPPPVIENPQS